MASQDFQELRDRIGEISMHIRTLLEAINVNIWLTDEQKEDLRRELGEVVGLQIWIIKILNLIILFQFVHHSAPGLLVASILETFPETGRAIVHANIGNI